MEWLQKILAMLGLGGAADSLAQANELKSKVTTLLDAYKAGNLSQQLKDELKSYGRDQAEAKVREKAEAEWETHVGSFARSKNIPDQIVSQVKGKAIDEIAKALMAQYDKIKV
jgi:hypothetical protein